jgi:hypothetical protein
MSGVTPLASHAWAAVEREVKRREKLRLQRAGACRVMGGEQANTVFMVESRCK